MFGIERTYDGGFTWEVFSATFATEAEATAFMAEQGWDVLAEQTYGEEGARVIAL